MTRKGMLERYLDFFRRKPADDVADELQFHLDMRAEEAQQAGLTEPAARAAALERFGEYNTIQGELLRIDGARARRRERSEWLGDVRRDAVFALRSLRRAPTFTIAAVCTLAIAIGANTAIYSVVHAMLLAPLPFAQPEQLVAPWGNGLGELVGLRAQWRSVATLTAYQQVEANFDDGTVAERLSGAAVADEFFPTLGVQPSIGRTFTARENDPGQTDVVVLSDGFWRRRFGADPGVVGRRVVIDGVSKVVVGVMPRTFAFPSSTVAFWRPVTILRGNPNALWISYGFTFVGRLRDGVTLDAARAELKPVAVGLRRANPVWDPGPQFGVDADVTSLHESLVGETKPLLMVVTGCALLVLLIACANVANLLLARATARNRELAVRAALGGGRRRLIRQLLTESVVLSGAGAVAGVVLAVIAVQWLVSALPADLPRASEIAVNGPVLLVALILAVITGLGFGALPAIRATRQHATADMVRAGRTGRGTSHQRVSAMLVVGEIALAVLVVTGAELLVRSFRELRRLDPGFQTSHVVSVRVTPTRTPYGEVARGDAFYDALLSRAATIPQVKSVAAVNGLPLARPAGGVAVRIEGRFEDAKQTLPWVFHLQVVTPEYMSVMGIPLRAGRNFTPNDRRDAEPVALVSERVARKMWPGQNPIGKRIGYPYDSPWITVVGVVADVKFDNLRDTTVSAMYVPFLQRPLDTTGRSRTDFTVLVNTAGDPVVAGRALRAMVTSIDRSIPVGAVETMDDVVSRSVVNARFAMSLVSGFAMVALLLGAIGIYGVMSYLVGQRRQELSVRTALGATTSDLMRMVLGRAAALAALGAVIGSAAAIVAIRPLQSLLYGVSTFDPVTYANVPLLFVVVALLAGAGPARRAARADPAAVLRAE